jgi:hypothetical protein
MAGLVGPAMADLNPHTMGKRGDLRTYAGFYSYDGHPGFHVKVIGPPAGQSQLRLADETSSSRPLLVAGDFGTARTPADRGLVLLGGRVLAPFNFQPTGNPKFGSVICIKDRKIAILSTAEFAREPVQVTIRCDSAFQTYPKLIERGRNLVSPAALREPAQKRIILATKGSHMSVFVFPTPVNLYIVANVLSRADPREGYGYEEAVSLSLGPDPAAYDYERLLVGDRERRTASAIVFDD